MTLINTTVLNVEYKGWSVEQHKQLLLSMEEDIITLSNCNDCESVKSLEQHIEFHTQMINEKSESKLELGKHYKSDSGMIVVATGYHSDGRWFYGKSLISDRYHNVGTEYAWILEYFKIVK